MARKKSLTTIHSIEGIPAFGTEAEEHAFWATHELSEALSNQAEPFLPEELPPSRPTTAVERERALLSGTGRRSVRRREA